MVAGAIVLAAIAAAATHAAGARLMTTIVKGVELVQRDTTNAALASSGRLVIISTETGVDMAPVQRLWLRFEQGEISETELVGFAADPATCTLAECAALKPEAITKLAEFAILRVSVSGQPGQPGSAKTTMAPRILPYGSSGGGQSTDTTRVAEAGTAAPGEQKPAGIAANDGAANLVQQAAPDPMAMSQLLVSIAGVLVAAAIPLVSIWLTHRLQHGKAAGTAAPAASGGTSGGTAKPRRGRARSTGRAAGTAPK